MLPKLLIVLLVLSAGFAVSGVTAVVSAHMSTIKSDTQLTTVSEVGIPREVRLVVKASEDSQAPIEVESEESIVEPEELEDAQVVLQPISAVVPKAPVAEALALAEQLKAEIEETDKEEKKPVKKTREQTPGSVFTVPFYSQFDDITPANWKKVSCGIAGVAMLIDFYSDQAVSADKLLQNGIAAGAFLSDAGWTHQGLINLTKEYGLNGESHSFSGSSMEVAFNKLKAVLEEGPVMASVHYTFQPTNPIPHLVVVNGVKDGKVFYNDPAEPSGGGSISIAQFQSAWKKRYIEIRPEV